LRAIYPRYRTPGAAEIPGHLHSNLVQIAATMGVPGLLAFAALFVSLFVAALAGLRSALARDDLAAGIKLGVIGGLAGFLVAGSFEWNFGDEELLYLLYVLVGIAWAARLWPRQHASAASHADAPPEHARAMGAAGS
jgi:O-antigen ligase